MSIRTVIFKTRNEFYRKNFSEFTEGDVVTLKNEIFSVEIRFLRIDDDFLYLEVRKGDWDKYRFETCPFFQIVKIKNYSKRIVG